MIRKHWKVASRVEKSLQEKFPELNPITLQLLANRKLTSQDAINTFLQPEYVKDVHDPFLLLDMDKAVERILQAVKKGEKILVYGDYDADGVCASALMVNLLKSLGAEPDIYIPYRDIEGYGLNAAAVSQIAQNGVNLVITVDCGIANHKEVQSLQSNRVDVIITDHHNPHSTLPKAYAIINPKLHTLENKYPNHELSGTAVAFKLACAILSKSTRRLHPRIAFPPEGFEKWLLDLVSVSLVTDMCLLVGENRTLVKYGIMVLRKTKRLGLQKLFFAAKINALNIGTRSIGFHIGPRLNAAGRIDHASTSYELLVTEDEKKAETLALQLNKKNQQRQALTEKILSEALEQIGDGREQSLLIAKHHEWQAGLVGLVAGKICDKFYRPTLVVGKNKEGLFVGSGRSIPDFNITEALEKCQAFLLHFGGHAQACGFTLRDEGSFLQFKEKMQQLAFEQLSSKKLEPALLIESVVKLRDIHWELYEDLEKFEPFGMGNQKPRFLVKGVKVADLRSVGQNGNHLRVMVQSEDGFARKVIGFDCSNEDKWGVDWCKMLKVGDHIDVVFEVEMNEWNGNRELQLTIIDMRLCQNML